jgi:hypothetical protein
MMEERDGVGDNVQVAGFNQLGAGPVRMLPTLAGQARRCKPPTACKTFGGGGQSKLG